MRALEKFIRLMLLLNVFRYEVLMVNFTGYASAMLILYPEHVYLCTAGHEHLQQVVRMQVMGWLAGVSTLLTLYGVTVRAISRSLQWSSTPRSAGLIGHAFFWIVSGGSLMWDSWQTPTSWGLVAMGILAFLTAGKVTLIEERRS